MGDATMVRDSDVVGEWRPPMTVVCRKGYVEPEPCDCGFVDEWEWRFVYGWNQAKLPRGDRQVRFDLTRGLPARAGDCGYWVIVGRDERCPSCGDIERFDADHEQVKRWSEQANVIHIRSWASAEEGGR